METIVATSEYELGRGKPMPSRNHSILQTRIGYMMLSQYPDRFQVGSEPTLATPGRPRVPDLAFFAARPIDWFDDEVKITEVPLGVVEILSPGQNETELIAKLPVYFDWGVQSAWLVVPVFNTIYVFDAPRSYQTFTPANPLLRDTVLNIELDLMEVFK